MIFAFGPEEFIDEILYHEEWLPVVFFTIIGTFFVENWFSKKWCKGIGTVLSVIIAVILSVVGVYLLSKGDNVDYELEKQSSVCTEKQKYQFFFTSWSIILFIIFNFIDAISYFFKIGEI